MRERNPIHEDVKKRESHLYGISGRIIQPETEPIRCAAFGGYFRYDVLDKLVLDGQLIDCFGPSIIEGTMTEDELSFAKRYEHRKYKIDYEFKKKNEIWAGTYNSFQAGSGRAECKTYLVDKDAFDIACGSPRTGDTERSEYGNLSGEESFLIEVIESKLPISEKDLHMVMSIAGNVTGDPVYKFEPKFWPDVDERFSGEGGCLPFSRKLHDDIENLINKGFLERDEEDPLVLSYSNAHMQMKLDV